MTKRWTFDNDELFELVRIGRKRGTCCRYTNDKDMANIGDIEEIFNSNNDTITIKITAVRKSQFCDIDTSWAIIEGEGDLSLEHWKRIHIEFFDKLYPDFQETDILELNEFKVI